jgi:hypothetical protein
VGASSHHRVVRRLDQHEAWGAAAGGSSGAAAAGLMPALGGSPAGGRAPGAGLLSPPKRARVPLFCDDGPAGSSSAAAGSPPRPVGVRLEFDGLGPGRAAGGPAAPALSGGAPSTSARSYEPSRLNPASGARPPPAGAGAGAGLPARPSPRRPASWRVPPASAMVTSPPGSTGRAPAAVGGGGGGGGGGATPLPAGSVEQQAPGTPQHAPVPDGQQSTSATPTTPSFRPPGTGAPGGASPSDYVTPQQRVRMAPPTAPLHRDCLLSAAASAAARLTAAADADGPGTVSSKVPPPPPATRHDGAPGGRPLAPLPAALLRNPALAPGCSPTDGHVAESSPMSESPAPPPGASPCAVPSPSWGPGMIAMLRGLQRTPLAVRRPLDGAALASAAGAAAGAAPAAAGAGDAAAFAAAAAVPLPCEPAPGLVYAPLAAMKQLALATPCGAAAGGGGGGALPYAPATAAEAAAFLHATPAAAAAALVQATPGTLQASQLSAVTPLPGFCHGGLVPLPLPLGGALGAGPQRAASGSSDASNCDKENAADDAIAAAVAAAADAAVAAAAPIAAAPQAAGFPQAWLSGGAPLTMHLVPVKVQLQPGPGAGAPVQAVLAAGAAKTVAGVSLAPQPAPLHAATGDCGSAEARSRLHALLEGP